MNISKIEKTEIRKNILAQRHMLTLAEIEKNSGVIDMTLRKLKPLQQAEVIMAYAAFGQEVLLDNWIDYAVKQQKTILLPRLNRDSDDLEAVEFRGWDNCCQGPFGIREPAGPVFNTDLLQAVIVPGVAFDGHGYRIGYGKGYYDHFLPQLPADTFLCGVAYEFQITAPISTQAHDIPVHWIVTEQSEIAINLNYF